MAIVTEVRMAVFMVPVAGAAVTAPVRQLWSFPDWESSRVFARF